MSKRRRMVKRASPGIEPLLLRKEFKLELPNKLSKGEFINRKVRVCILKESQV